jgi:surfeit locus 1 family protein
MKARIWPILLASGLSLALLLWLGAWQIQRLAWKNELIANFDKTKITVAGRFIATPPQRFQSSYEGGPAWLLLQGFAKTDGGLLLVARGKIPQSAELPVNNTELVTITGHLTNHNKGRGYFDVDNQPADNRWYYWDVDAMLGQPSTNGEVLHLIPGSPGTEGLYVDAPKSELRNNHLGYAITWFGLAAVLVVMTGLFLYRRRHPGESRDLSSP